MKTFSFNEYNKKEFWDKRATALLNQNINYPNEINQYVIDRKVWIISEMIEHFKPLHVADAGCGSGGVLIPLVKKYPKIQFYGFDFSRENIRTLRNDDYGRRVLTDVTDISERIGYMKNSFDLLYSFDVFCHLKFDRIPKAIKIFNRVAKRSYYIFDSCEYTIMPYYYFLFSRILPKKSAIKFALKYTKKVEENKLPEMRGLMYEND